MRSYERAQGEATRIKINDARLSGELSKLRRIPTELLSNLKSPHHCRITSTVLIAVEHAPALSDKIA